MIGKISYRTLGRTGISVSELAVGCGPIANLMTGQDRENQIAVLQRAIDCGLNWIDTAATYGQGQSETSIGRALNALNAAGRVHIATKVRLLPEDLQDIKAAVRKSIEGSLTRLGVSRVALLQLHNAITDRRGDEATSITPQDVLGRSGVLDALLQLRAEGLTEFVGLTAVGQANPLRTVIASGGFDTMQVPYNLLNPSAGFDLPASFPETNYGNVMSLAAEQRMGVFVIRVFAAGALLNQDPGPYTAASKFFTLDLYRRDQIRAQQLRESFGSETDLKELSVRFALQHPCVHSAIIGFSQPQHVAEAITFAQRGAIPDLELKQISPVLSATD